MTSAGADVRPTGRRESDAWLSAESYWSLELVESSWLGHGPFAAWLMAAHRPRTVVELGTHNGFSYFVFCAAVRRLAMATRCFAVDTWEGDDQAGLYGEEVFESVTSINEQYADFSTLCRGLFADRAGDFEAGSVDLLHIDGRHGYEDVSADFGAYLPALSERAIVIFHDVAEYQPGFGVHRFWDELSEQYPSFRFTHEHGLGVLLVGEEQTPAVLAFLEATQRAADDIRADYERLGDGVRRQWETLRQAQQAEALVIRNDELTDELTRAHEAVSNLTADGDLLRRRLGIVRRRKRRAERRLAAIESSRWWRTGAPWRRLRALARR